ncbi:MAG: rhamnan synthesis F family protein [Cyanobacteriota bacterium]|nr:rhamnan synthesis F family protein [Cyanobacteriota bacterium]
MNTSLNAEILRSIAAGDLPTAKAKIERAIALHYPDALVASWQDLLNKTVQDKKISADGIYPRPLAPLPNEPNDPGLIRPDVNFQSQLQATWKNALIATALTPPADESMRAEIERILASICRNPAEIPLPCFAGMNIFKANAHYTKLAYIEDNPDIAEAISSKRVQSWADHLLRNGIPEMIQGLRYCRYFSAQETSGDCTILHVIDRLADQDLSQVCALLLDQHPRFAPLLLVYETSTARFAQAGRVVDQGQAFYAMAKTPGRLLIRLDTAQLEEAIHPWLAARPLADDRVLYGKNHHLQGQPFSIHDALLDDITSGNLICSSYQFFAVFDQLIEYKSPKGFFCALIWELFRSGHRLHYIDEVWSVEAGRSILNQNYSWSPFYRPGDVEDLRSDDPQCHAWRRDQVTLWQRHLEGQGLGSSWKVHQDYVSYSFAPTDAVTILIPFGDQADCFLACVNAIFERQERIPIQVVAIGDASGDQAMAAVIERLRQTHGERLSVVHNPGPFNPARLYNRAAKAANSKYLLLLDASIRIACDYALTNLLCNHIFFNSIGTGSLIFDQSGTVQHNGFALTPLRNIAITCPTKGKQPALNLARNQSESAYARLYRTHECSAVSTACFLVATSDFVAVHGLDEALGEPDAAVDLCLRLRDAFPPRPCMCVTDQLMLQQAARSADPQAASREGASGNGHGRGGNANAHQLLIEKQAASFIDPDPCFSKILFNDDPINKPSRVAAPNPKSPRIDLTTLYFCQNETLPRKKVATVFVHYDSFGELSKNCKIYLQALSSHSNLYFVSSSAQLAQNASALSWLDQLCSQVIVRKNSGYDFGCWSHVIQRNYDLFCEYDGLLLVNDSVIGPFSDLQDIFTALTTLAADFAGLTACLTPAWHIQSYFTYYKQRLVRSRLFKQHWHDIRALPSKQAVIMNYEVGWSTFLQDMRFSGRVLFDAFTLADNPVHVCWDALIEAGYPFVKRELLRDNPLRRDLSRLPTLLQRLQRNLALDISSPWLESVS